MTVGVAAVPAAGVRGGGLHGPVAGRAVLGIRGEAEVQVREAEVDVVRELRERALQPGQAHRVLRGSHHAFAARAITEQVLKQKLP